MMNGMKRMLMMAAAWVLCLGGLAGCGAEPGPRSITGKITQGQESVEIQGRLRASLIWFLLDSDGTFSWVAQDVEIDEVSRFVLELEAPPSNAVNWFNQMDPDYVQDHWIAEGVVVIYDDRNENGSLDMLDENATEYVDHVVGPADPVLVLFFDFMTDQPTMSVILDAGQAEGDGYRAYQMGEEIPIRLADRPEQQLLMCSQFPACRTESESPDLICRLDCE